MFKSSLVLSTLFLFACSAEEKSSDNSSKLFAVGDSPWIGGTGGKASSFNCQESGIKKITTKSGSRIDSIVVECGDGRTSGRIGGGGGDFTHTHSCSGGATIDGIWRETGSEVDGVRFKCTNGKYTRNVGALNKKTSTSLCAKGFYATGINYRAGSRIDGLSLKCDDIGKKHAYDALSNLEKRLVDEQRNVKTTRYGPWDNGTSECRYWHWKYYHNPTADGPSGSDGIAKAKCTKALLNPLWIKPCYDAWKVAQHDWKEFKKACR